MLPAQDTQCATRWGSHIAKVPFLRRRNVSRGTKRKSGGGKGDDIIGILTKKRRRSEVRGPTAKA